MFMPGLSPASLGWRVHLDMADAMRRIGDEFEIVTTADPSAPHAAAALESAGVRLLPEGGPLPRAIAEVAAPFLRSRALLPSALALSRHLRRFGSRIDALYVEVAYPHGVAASMAARAAGWSGPLLVTPAGDDVVVIPEAHFGFRRYPLPRRLVEWSLRGATGVRCVSPRIETVIREFEPRGVVRTFPINVTDRTVEIAREPSAARERRRREARRRWFTEWQLDDGPLIVSLGRLHPVKALDVLIAALPTIDGATLAIAGPSLEVKGIGDMREALRALARARGVSERIRWIDKIGGEAVFDLLAAADLVAVPSHHESLNKVCIESAAVGTPFVVTETSGICSYLPRGFVGTIVPPRDPRSLAAASSETLRGRRRSEPHAAEELATRFAPDRIAVELHDMLGELR